MADQKEEKPTKSPQKTAKVFDIAEPGSTPASQTSRPVILGHNRKIKQDPMVVQESAMASDPSPNEESLKKPEHRVEPIVTESSVAEAEAEAKEEVKDKQTESIESKKFSKPIPSKGVEKAQEEITKSDESSELIDVLEGDAKNERAAELEAEAEAKKNEEIEKLIASKKYYVRTHAPAGKRNTLWVMLLIVIVIGGLVGYFIFGPGKNVWVENFSAKPATETQVQTQKTASSSPSKQAVATTATYKNQEMGITFDYPKSWKIEVGKDLDRPKIDLITLTSPVEKIKRTIDGQPIEANGYLRTKVYVENTTNSKQYSTGSYNLLSCVTDQIKIGDNFYKLGLVSSGSRPEPAQQILSKNDCQKDGGTYSLDDQFQFPTRKNTYVIVSEYLLTDEDYKKSGISDKDLQAAKIFGVRMLGADFKSTKAYTQLLTTLQSLKSL